MIKGGQEAPRREPNETVAPENAGRHQGCFCKGQSGNPAGKSKAATDVSTLTQDAIEVLKLEAMTAVLNGETVPPDSPLAPYVQTYARKRNRKIRCTVTEVGNALKLCDGVQSVAGRLLGISRAAVGEWVERYPELRSIINAQQGELIDVARNVVVAGLRRGDKTCAMFYLKTHAVDEGWSQRTELVREGGAPLSLRPERNLDDVPDEDLIRIGRAIRDALERAAVEQREEPAHVLDARHKP